MQDLTAVVIGVVIKDNKVLLSKRGNNQTYSGYWEFPGGKVEAGETLEQALARELAEEVAITVAESNLLFTKRHKQLKLHFFLVKKYSGKPRAVENQQLDWFDILQVATMKFPDANKKVLRWLSLLD